MSSLSESTYIADKTSNQETSCTTVDEDPLPLTSPARTADISLPSRVTKLAFFEPPYQRQCWGDTQILPHINWGDLFFDLFYVAAAYNLSYVLLYSPNAEGFLYLLGLFGPILLEWFQRTFFDARFAYGKY